MHQRLLLLGLILVVILALVALVIAVAALGAARHQRRHQNKPDHPARRSEPTTSPDECDADSPEGWRRHARPEDAEPD